MSIMNHSHWSYVHQLSYRLGVPNSIIQPNIIIAILLPILDTREKNLSWLVDNPIDTKRLVRIGFYQSKIDLDISVKDCQRAEPFSEVTLESIITYPLVI